MKPYYEHAGITIYHGDCREIAPSVERVCVVTDPPYGIGADRNLRANKQHGRAACPSRDYGRGEWDSHPAPSGLLMSLVGDSPSVIWGGNYFSLPPSSAWLVWDKDNGDNGYADCELAWTNLSQAVRRIRWRWMGMIQELAGDKKEPRLHPTQKPVPVMSWCLGFMPEGIVLDPFMGSGTTLVAAKNLGRKAIGIEIEERYCEIAAKRLAQEQLPLDTAGRESRASNTVGK